MARERAPRAEAKPLRLFIAAELPEPVQDAVEEAFAPWRELFPESTGTSR
jgi:hypothetical protein